MNLQQLFLLTCVVALVFLSPGVALAGVPIAGAWNWIDSILSDQQRMVQIGALVVVLAIFVLVRK